MYQFTVNKVLSSSVFILVALSLIFSVVITPAYASWDVNYEDVDLGTPSKVFYEDNSVMVTYDLSTVPYSRVYGNPVGDDDLYSLITETTDIYFQQSLDESVLVFTPLLSGNVSASNFKVDAGNRHWCPLVPSTHEFALSEIEIMKVNGVDYPVYTYVRGPDAPYLVGYGYIDTDPTFSAYFNSPDRFQLFAYVKGIYDEPISTAWNFATSEAIDASIIAGFYEDVTISPREYDSIYAYTWPLGKNGDYERVVDISDIRYGANFDIGFRINYNVDIGGSAASTGLSYNVYFLDAEYSIVSVDTVDLDLPISSGMNHLFTNFSFTVPDGAEYFYIKASTGHINVTNCNLVDWRLTDLKLNVAMSDVEHNSQMMEQINEKLDEIKNQQQETNDKLDEIITGTPGANAGADNMQDVAGDYKDHVNNQLQNGQAQMDKLDQLPRPDVSGAVTLPEWTASDQFLGFNAVVATIWENETIYEIMVVASILMLASYILFGKKV